MVFFMATIFGDVQYTQNGTFTNPCFFGGNGDYFWGENGFFCGSLWLNEMFFSLWLIYFLGRMVLIMVNCG